MATVADSRLRTEYTRISKDIQDIPEILEAGPVDDSNMYVWRAILRGPSGTPYEDGRFQLRIEFPTDYPWKPPEIQFITKIYHPNICPWGVVCADILTSESWAPHMFLVKVLLSILSLLDAPNADEPANNECAEQYKNDPNSYWAEAKRWTEEHA